MNISQDDLNDWAIQASNLEQLVKEIGDALLDENIALADELSDCACTEASLMTQRLVRSGAARPPQLDRSKRWWPAYPDPGFGKTPESVSAAEALEQAALLVLSLENEHGVRGGMGEVLADLAAELNMLVLGRPEDRE